MKVCRNTRCAFFFFIDYKNRFIFFKLRYFVDLLFMMMLILAMEELTFLLIQ